MVAGSGVQPVEEVRQLEEEGAEKEVEEGIGKKVEMGTIENWHSVTGSPPAASVPIPSINSQYRFLTGL